MKSGRVARFAMVAFSIAAMSAMVLGRPTPSSARKPPLPTDVLVDVGVLPVAPLGPPPCLQSGAIGGPADPCAYKVHTFTPGEVHVAKGGQVTFQAHGGGHGLAIYKVNKKTTRDGIGQLVCSGLDPVGADPAQLSCNLSATNANASHTITDGAQKLVIDVAANITNAHPDNRVWFEPGRLMSAGGKQFLNGGTIPSGPTSDGQLVTFRFPKAGRYLVVCMNRTHFLNDWEFGFVSVGQ